MSELIAINGLKKYFYGSKGLLGRSSRVVKAVDDVSFSITRGETFGLVGESGCGKSTLGRTILRLVPHTEGQVRYDGVNLMEAPPAEMRQMRRKLQIIFQDPYSSLNPRMTVLDTVRAPLDVHQVGSEGDRKDIVCEMLETAGLERDCLSKYPHEFSGGQRQRIGMARALILKPDFVVCDEPVSALDVSVRSQILNLMQDLQSRFGLTYLFISHDLSVVKHISDWIAVMYLGRIVEIASKELLYDNPLHPYLKALLSAIPIPDVSQREKRQLLKGDLPSPFNPPPGCRFHTRCPSAMGRCREEEPAMLEAEPGHQVACHLYHTK